MAFLQNMASIQQYEFFKALYDEEFTRYRDLESRARLYLTVVTLYLGAFAFKLSDLKNFMDEYHVSAYLFLPPTITLVGALVFALIAMRIRPYEGASDPEKLLLSLGAENPSDEQFFDDRIVDLAVATNRNVDHNNRAANLLAYSSTLIAIAVMLHGGIILLALLNAFKK